MKIAFGCDHAGIVIKDNLISFIKSLGHEVIDCGTNSKESCDYPDFALKVSQNVISKNADKGILICGTGIGMSIAANKVKGIRAAVCWSKETAQLIARVGAFDVDDILLNTLGGVVGYIFFVIGRKIVKGKNKR